MLRCLCHPFNGKVLWRKFLFWKLDSWEKNPRNCTVFYSCGALEDTIAEDLLRL